VAALKIGDVELEMVTEPIEVEGSGFGPKTASEGVE
jgi:hypothetical protein